MKLVIAVDDSDQAGAVLTALAPWLRRTGPEVYLVSVVDMSQVHEARRGDQPNFEPTPAIGATRPSQQQPIPKAAETHGQALERAHMERDEFLRDLARDSLAGLTVTVHVISDDDTAGAIGEYGLQIGADMVAVGTHGRSGITRALMGSVAEDVVRRSELPVIVVREGMHTSEVGPTSV
jgi:nucleotide-binding universal stress UspA family protein